VLAALTASVDRAVQFEPYTPGGAGTLKMPLAARLLLHDGIHRRRAIEDVLAHKPEFGKETVAVVLFVDPGLRRAEQMFSDLKRRENHSARSQAILCDDRDEMARLARALVSQVPVFAGMTEMVRSKISNRSLKLFTLSAIYHATTVLLSDRRQEAYADKRALAAGFWSTVAEHVPDWQAAKDGRVSPADLRKRYVHAQAIALAALARVGAALFEKHPKTWQPRLKGLRTLDWARENPRLWEGRAMTAGRLSKTRTAIVLTANAIKGHLRLALSPAEERLEREFRNARG
jgi:DNA sulfur modification protein DndB